MNLSIITINYNNFNGLDKTIKSVITQTFKDFEWIVIDGGSTDGSKELIEKYNKINYFKMLTKVFFCLNIKICAKIIKTFAHKLINF